MFEIGERVKCIDASDHLNGGAYLERDKIYTVKRESDGYSDLRLEGVRLGWRQNRFIPAKVSNEDRMNQRRRELCNSK